MKDFPITFPDGVKRFKAGEPLVILGANGSGKTRLSVKLEELNDQSYNGRYSHDNLYVKRISAQKSLSLPNDFNVRSADSAEKIAHIGSDSAGSKRSHLYGSEPATHLLTDYQNALVYLFALSNRQLEEQNRLDFDAVKENIERPLPIKTVAKKVEEIWNQLLPNRELDLSDNNVHAKGDARYHGKEMSDGERVILYLIVQVLTVKGSSVILVDEPEMHIHKAIVAELWDVLEAERQDCLFVYITHDIDFAVSRNSNEVLWVKSFDGNNKWDYEFLTISEFSDLPQALLLEILGSAKKIVFIEGTRDSLDYQLYKRIYGARDIHVVTCGGCQQVINCVKAKKGYNKLDNINVYGVIDRDFRPQSEIDMLRADDIYCLSVAEVENLFVVPELLEVMAEYFKPDESKLGELIEYILGEFEQRKSDQIIEACHSELKHQLKIMHLDKDKLTPQAVKLSIEEEFSEEKIATILAGIKQEFNGISDIKGVLRVFNHKGLCDGIAGKLGIRDITYQDKVIELLKFGPADLQEKISNALLIYIPDFRIEEEK